MDQGRKLRGMEIAATARIAKKGKAWMVPSQSMNGRYTVTREAGEYRCSCPDHELRRVMCKHAYAVEFATKRELNPDGTYTDTTALRVTYGQDWRSYNSAQTHEKEHFCRLLRELCGLAGSGLQEKRGKGRPRLRLDEALFSACYKVYSGVSGRRFMTDMRDAQSRGIVTKAPCYNSIFNVIESEDVTPIIRGLIGAASIPLRSVETRFAADSTGFGVERFYRHYSAKYGHDQYSRDYLKCHAMIGVQTHVVAAVEVTDRDTHDYTQFKPLLESTAQRFSMAEIFADKAYISKESVTMVESHGASPFIPMKPNYNDDPKVPAWSKLYRLYQFKREEFLEHYHQRSNAESAFSSMKRKFGDFIRSRTPVAQVNEMLLKVLAHNIVCLIHSMYELGVEAVFGGLPIKSPACPQNGGLEG